MYEDLINPYQPSKENLSIQLGGIEVDDKLLANAPANLVLKSFNRHGLIAGATGSGKTKTIQTLCEQLSLAGIPSLVMDIKGDVSGLAMPGEPTPSLIQRAESIHIDYFNRGFPVELFTLNESVPGIPLRTTVEDFGSLLFSRMLDINETQAGVVTILFEFAKKNKIPLVDLEDFKSLLQFLQSEEGKMELESSYGSVSSSSVGSIMRKIIELEAQGGGSFFGKPSFKVQNLLRTNATGLGIISILRLMDMQDRPLLFSTFMIKLLSDVYRQFEELGDPAKPKLVLFIDEAHLIFNNASKPLLDLLNTMVKLIRSKGVGLFFCTQTPNDIPESVLSQLGLKVQHVLRAFTAKDRQTMKLVAQNFPVSTHYDTEQLLTNLGIGEALVTALDAKGQPTPLIRCMIRPPESRMGVLKDAEVEQIFSASTLYAQYSQRVTGLSAKEVLVQRVKIPKKESSKPQTRESQEQSTFDIEKLSKNTLVRQLVRDSFRWLLKILGSKK